MAMEETGKQSGKSEIVVIRNSLNVHTFIEKTDADDCIDDIPLDIKVPEPLKGE